MGIKDDYWRTGLRTAARGGVAVRPTGVPSPLGGGKPGLPTDIGSITIRPCVEAGDTVRPAVAARAQGQHRLVSVW